VSGEKGSPGGPATAGNGDEHVAVRVPKRPPGNQSDPAAKPFFMAGKFQRLREGP